MLKHSTLYLVTTLFLLQTHNGVSLSGKTDEGDVVLKRGFTEKAEDCFAEPEMDLETNRRVLLLQKKYISYETLKRDMVPCDRPGFSYYQCRAASANRYSRGCEVITSPMLLVIAAIKIQKWLYFDGDLEFSEFRHFATSLIISEPIERLTL
ncbi:hypothetical protein ACFE04_015648 [Oxalis oulophora]